MPFVGATRGVKIRRETGRGERSRQPAAALAGGDREAVAGAVKTGDDLGDARKKLCAPDQFPSVPKTTWNNNTDGRA